MGAGQVLGPDARCQAVIAIVGVIDHFFFVVERRDGDNRAEDFFAICPARNRQASDYRRLEEITIAGNVR